MSAASCLPTEDQFLCSICLDVFSDPVSIPCGHNFCKSCISQHWNASAKRQCPVCNMHFNRGIRLQTNTFISEMLAQFRRSAQHETAKPGEVPCDVCTRTKLKALKSCLVCLTSYCETHLEPHLTTSSLKKHQLIEPVKNLEARMCKNHNKLLELFCKTDQVCVCAFCTIGDHKTHDVVPLGEECEGKKAKLSETEAEIQQMIHERRLKIEEMKRSVELSTREADREMAEGVQVFTALRESVEKDQDEFIQTIKEKQRATEKRAEGFIKELEQEVTELRSKQAEVKQLSHSHQFRLLQTFKCLRTKNWTEVRVRPPAYEGAVVRAVKQLEETLRRQVKRLFEAELQRVQRFAAYVLLKPLILMKSLFRLTECRCAFALKGFSSGRFYFEVDVEKGSAWTLGVAGISNTEGHVLLSPRNNYWTICCGQRGQYHAAADPRVRLSVGPQPGNVGVFVDYDEGLVSFYDVDSATLIYSFTDCSFRDELHPFFSSCPNDGDGPSWFSFFLRQHQLCLCK